MISEDRAQGISMEETKYPLSTLARIINEIRQDGLLRKSLVCYQVTLAAPKDSEDLNLSTHAKGEVTVMNTV